jgi:hypothetical protein
LGKTPFTFFNSSSINPLNTENENIFTTNEHTGFPFHKIVKQPSGDVGLKKAPIKNLRRK